MGIKITLDASGLDRLRKNAERIDGERRVPIGELLNPAFMRKHSGATSLDDILRKENVSDETFLKMSEAEKDELVKKTTTFGSWQEMINAAAKENIKKELFR